MSERLAFKSAGAVRPKPLWKMTDDELCALADSRDDPRSGAAWREMESRARDLNPPAQFER